MKNIILAPLYWIFSVLSNIMVYGMFWVLGMFIDEKTKYID